MSPPVSPAAAWSLLVASNLAYFKEPVQKLVLYARALVIFARFQALAFLLSVHIEFSQPQHDASHHLWATAHVSTVFATFFYCLSGIFFRSTTSTWYWTVGVVSVGLYATTSIYNISVVVENSQTKKAPQRPLVLLASEPAPLGPQNRPLCTLLQLEDTQLFATAVLMGLTSRNPLKIGPFVIRSLVYMLDVLYEDPETLYGPAINPLLDFLQEPLLRTAALADFAAVLPFVFESNPYALFLYLLVVGLSLETSETARRTLHRLAAAVLQLLAGLKASTTVQGWWISFQTTLLDLYPEVVVAVPKDGKQKYRRAPSFAYESLVVINDTFEEHRARY